MLSVSLKLLETFSVFFFLNKAVLKDPRGLEHWAPFNFSQCTALSNEFLCVQIVVLSLPKKAIFVTSSVIIILISQT